MTRRATVLVRAVAPRRFGGSYREICEMDPIALRDLAILLSLALLLVCVLLALRATQPEDRRRRD